MSTGVSLILSGLIGYLFGAIPFGYLLVKLRKGIDLRQFGSGRTGGTNSFRAGGLAIGVATSILDVLKAAVAVWSVRALFGGVLTDQWLPWSEALAGVFSVVGHNWSIFIGWRGGAGTGPNVGWAGAIWLPIVPIALVIVLFSLLVIGIASIASLAMVAAVPLSFLVLYLAGIEPFDATLAYIVGGLAAGSIIAWSLRPNIARLIAGNERLVGPKAKSKAGNKSEVNEEKEE
jgi:glycerol-3-phosphate acyltransferase PlsY